MKYQTREEFRLVVGATTADIAVIEAFAHKYGLTVAERSPAKRSVVLTGTAQNMQSAFGTTLSYYDTPQGKYRGRTGPIMLPKELQPIVTAVLGLDNRPCAKPHVRRSQATHTAGALTGPASGPALRLPRGDERSRRDDRHHRTRRRVQDCG